MGRRRKASQKIAGKQATVPVLSGDVATGPAFAGRRHWRRVEEKGHENAGDQKESEGRKGSLRRTKSKHSVAPAIGPKTSENSLTSSGGTADSGQSMSGVNVGRTKSMVSVSSMVQTKTTEYLRAATGSAIDARWSAEGDGHGNNSPVRRAKSKHSAAPSIGSKAVEDSRVAPGGAADARWNGEGDDDGETVNVERARRKHSGALSIGSKFKENSRGATGEGMDVTHPDVEGDDNGSTAPVIRARSKYSVAPTIGSKTTGYSQATTGGRMDAGNHDRQRNDDGEHCSIGCARSNPYASQSNGTKTTEYLRATTEEGMDVTNQNVQGDGDGENSPAVRARSKYSVAPSIGSKTTGHSKATTADAIDRTHQEKANGDGESSRVSRSRSEHSVAPSIGVVDAEEDNNAGDFGRSVDVGHRKSMHSVAPVIIASTGDNFGTVTGGMVAIGLGEGDGKKASEHNGKPKNRRDVEAKVVPRTNLSSSLGNLDVIGAHARKPPASKDGSSPRLEMSDLVAHRFSTYPMDMPHCGERMRRTRSALSDALSIGTKVDAGEPSWMADQVQSEQRDDKDRREQQGELVKGKEGSVGPVGMVSGGETVPEESFKDASAILSFLSSSTLQLGQLLTSTSTVRPNDTNHNKPAAHMSFSHESAPHDGTVLSSANDAVPKRATVRRSHARGRYLVSATVTPASSALVSNQAATATIHGAVCSTSDTVDLRDVDAVTTSMPLPSTQADLLNKLLSDNVRNGDEE